MGRRSRTSRTTPGGVLTDLSWRAPFGAYALALVLAGPAFVALPEPDASTFPDDAPDATSETPAVPWGRRFVPPARSARLPAD